MFPIRSRLQHWEIQRSICLYLKDLNSFTEIDKQNCCLVCDNVINGLKQSRNDFKEKFDNMIKKMDLKKFLWSTLLVVIYVGDFL